MFWGGEGGEVDVRRRKGSREEGDEKKVMGSKGRDGNHVHIHEHRVAGC